MPIANDRTTSEQHPRQREIRERGTLKASDGRGRTAPPFPFLPAILPTCDDVGQTGLAAAVEAGRQAVKSCGRDVAGM